MNAQTPAQTAHHAVETQTYAGPDAVLHRLIAEAALDDQARAAIAAHGADLVRAVRNDARPGLMEVFLAEYGLSTDEGIALMCLAEALLRVPDAPTIDALIEDKIAPGDWAKHLGHASSPLVNASTWALMLTGKVLKKGAPSPAAQLRHAVKRLGEPVIRSAVRQAMREMGRQFVLGETIQAAQTRAAKAEARGYTYSYDMLGEAAFTDADALRFAKSYADAIDAIGAQAAGRTIADAPGISVKLSALHPRYTESQQDRVMAELLPRLRDLAVQAKSYGIGLNIDAEEADRLALSLDVIAALMADPALDGWDGLGVVVQAYGLRAGHMIDALYDLAQLHNRRIMVRLVKGAYWDTEVKRAQVMGMPGYPVFVQKPASDVSYIALARRLLRMTDRIYPQFATHNAHTIAAVLHMGQGQEDAFEFQRLHGMGAALHDVVHGQHKTRCRIYAPVGAHRDLLAYLVRRLLENGANSSFVNQVVDEAIPAETVAACPFAALATGGAPALRGGDQIFLPERQNSKGWDVNDRAQRRGALAGRQTFAQAQWAAGPMVGFDRVDGPVQDVRNPADPADLVGQVQSSIPADVDGALGAAMIWEAPLTDRAAALNRAADLYESHAEEILALLAREAGKTLMDAVAELREAGDFLRYYAAQAQDGAPLGRVCCISPWNFPLAIFTGQIAAALMTGNAVLAKPAPQTPLIAALAVRLLHSAGVPRAALQLLPGGAEVGAQLTSDPRIDGVVFTGSTATAQIIRRAMADHLAPGAPLIAETGGLNAMIVDSTALPEQAVQAVIESAFQSAGQRCSALRCLYVQEDIWDHFVPLLTGAMDELRLGAPWDFATDVGPVIDSAAQDGIAAYVAQARAAGRVLHELSARTQGHFIAPALIQLPSITALEREVFGPILHIAPFKAGQVDQVISDINARGFGLTLGLMTRLDARIDQVVGSAHVGNIYVNRNQIGAVVGSQPFGGEGLSGTGPKAGGPHYLPRFQRRDQPPTAQGGLRPTDMPGPTGEANRLYLSPRAPVLCLGPGAAATAQQAAAVTALGGAAIEADGADVQDYDTISGAIWWGDAVQARQYNQALAQRDGPLLPLMTQMPDAAHVLHERHLCVDTTAAGGNAQLLIAMS